MKICSVTGCNNIHNAKGYCGKHYRQLKSHGKILSIAARDFNEIVDKGTYYELILTNRKLEEEVGRAKIDKEDLSLVRTFSRWSLSKAGYAEHTNFNVKMHRLIMNAKEGEEVDHVKPGIKYKLDNRKKNLRIANRSQNNSNKNMHANNTSGYKGVSITKEGRYRSQIQVNKHKMYLGTFDTAEKAYSVYVKAAKAMHGEFFRA